MSGGEVKVVGLMAALERSVEAAKDARDRKVRGELRVCPRDGEPVVFTFEFPGAEHYCVVCGWTGGVFEASSAEATTAVAERHAELRIRYEAERAERTGRPVPLPPPQDVERPTCVGCGTVAEGPLDHSGKPAHWYSRTIDGVTERACSRGCIPARSGMVMPW